MLQHSGSQLRARTNADHMRAVQSGTQFFAEQSLGVGFNVLVATLAQHVERRG